MKEKKEIEVEVSEKEPRVYEVGFHIVPTIAEEDLGARVTAIRDVIDAEGGKMISDGYPRHLELAYPMLKIASNKRALHHSAYFGWMKFDAEPKAAKAIEAKLKKDDNIIRFILVKTVRENTMVPRKVFQQKRTEETRTDDKAEDKPKMTEAEIDKTIEDLVIS